MSSSRRKREPFLIHVFLWNASGHKLFHTYTLICHCWQAWHDRVTGLPNPQLKWFRSYKAWSYPYYCVQLVSYRWILEYCNHQVSYQEQCQARHHFLWRSYVPQQSKQEVLSLIRLGTYISAWTISMLAKPYSRSMRKEERRGCVKAN